MKDSTITNWTLDITGPGDVAGDQETGFPPNGHIRILIEESAEESDQTYREDTRLWHTLTELASGIPQLLDGERLNLEVNSGTIEFQPRTERDVVEIHQQIHWLSEDNSVYDTHEIERTAFVQEVYRAIRSWHDAAGVDESTRPGPEWFQDLTTALAEAKEAMRQSGIEVPE